MDRNSLSNDLKHHSICTSGGRPMKENNRNITKLKDSWDHTSYINSMDNLGGDLLGGFSWPPRSYTCTFCKREFRSAQALGGHMNVHRRDRARLRQSPPRDGQFYPGNNLLNLNLDPNPNPNPNFSSSSQPSSPQKMFPPFTSKLPPLLSPSLSSLSSPSSVSQSEIFERGIADHTGAPTHHLCPRGANSAKMKSQKTVLGVDKFNGVSHDKECKIVKRAEIVTLNLEIGLLSESKVDDLDLELRLGYS